MSNGRQDLLKTRQPHFTVCIFYIRRHAFCFPSPFFCHFPFCSLLYLPHNATSSRVSGTVSLRFPFIGSLRDPGCVARLKLKHSMESQRRFNTSQYTSADSKIIDFRIINFTSNVWMNDVSPQRCFFFPPQQSSSVVLVFGLLCFMMPSCFIPVEWIPNLGLMD